MLSVMYVFLIEDYVINKQNVNNYSKLIANNAKNFSHSIQEIRENLKTI